MTTKVLILLGTKKGAFILESDAARRSWALRGPFCETWPMNHVIADPATRHDLWRRRQRVVRPGGLEVDRSRRDLDAFERGPRLPARARSRSRRSGAWRRATGSLYAGVEPAGLFRSDDGGAVVAARRGPARPPVAAALAAGRRRADPALAGAASRATTRQIWVGISARRRVPHGRRRRDLGAAQPRHARRLPAGGAELPGVSASACTAWCMAPGHARPALPAEPLRHVSQRRRRPAAGRASRRACRRPSASRRRPIRATRRRSTCCR